MKIHSLLLPPGLALAFYLIFSVTASAQMVVGPSLPLPKLPVGAGSAGGPGGQYHGPSDIALGPLPSFDPNDPNTCPAQTQAVCSPSLLPDRCGPATSCPALRLVEHGTGQCVHCQNDPDGEDEECYTAQGWSLTFGQARSFCHAPDPSCLDAYRNVTVCATHPNSCEIHLYESDWINHDLFDNRPVCAPVAAQACLGNDALFDHPQAFNSLHEATEECGPHTVCLTFNKDCLCNAVFGWESSLGLGTAPSLSHDIQALLHIGFTTCETCNCPPKGGIPVDP